ncbi:hypothetical protein BV20DRAFT_347200 [Pilatotrama ljubarskyi]|nr:hypothetical protein BV20DRAFT_347200 [Pilatotrama ljubarskyi]
MIGSRRRPFKTCLLLMRPRRGAIASQTLVAERKRSGRMAMRDCECAFHGPLLRRRPYSLTAWPVLCPVTVLRKQYKGRPERTFCSQSRDDSDAAEGALEKPLQFEPRGSDRHLIASIAISRHSSALRTSSCYVSGQRRWCFRILRPLGQQWASILQSLEVGKNRAQLFSGSRSLQYTERPASPR